MGTFGSQTTWITLVGTISDEIVFDLTGEIVLALGRF
jgi:hypothetical protein